MTRDDRILGVLPFFHVFANTCVLNRTILNGGDDRDAAALRCRSRRWRRSPAPRSTALPGVPTMYQALLDHPDLAKTDFSSLRICISGGAPMPAELREKFDAATGAYARRRLWPHRKLGRRLDQSL